MNDEQDRQTGELAGKGQVMDVQPPAAAGLETAQQTAIQPGEPPVPDTPSTPQQMPVATAPAEEAAESSSDNSAPQVANSQKDTEEPAPPQKPPKNKNSTPYVAVTMSVIIALLLAGLAVFAYLQSQPA